MSRERLAAELYGARLHQDEDDDVDRKGVGGIWFT